MGLRRSPDGTQIMQINNFSQVCLPVMGFEKLAVDGSTVLTASVYQTTKAMGIPSPARPRARR